MLTSQRASAAVFRTQRTAPSLPLRSRSSSVIRRFRENERPASAADVDSMEEKLHTGKETDTKLTPEQIDSVSQNIQANGGLKVVESTQ